MRRGAGTSRDLLLLALRLYFLDGVDDWPEILRLHLVGVVVSVRLHDLKDSLYTDADASGLDGISEGRALLVFRGFALLRLVHRAYCLGRCGCGCNWRLHAVFWCAWLLVVADLFRQVRHSRKFVAEA